MRETLQTTAIVVHQSELYRRVEIRKSLLKKTDPGWTKNSKRDKTSEELNTFPRDCGLVEDSICPLKTTGDMNVDSIPSVVSITDGLIFIYHISSISRVVLKRFLFCLGRWLINQSQNNLWFSAVLHGNILLLPTIPHSPFSLKLSLTSLPFIFDSLHQSVSRFCSRKPHELPHQAWLLSLTQDEGTSDPVSHSRGSEPFYKPV